MRQLSKQNNVMETKGTFVFKTKNFCNKMTPGASMWHKLVVLPWFGTLPTASPFLAAPLQTQREKVDSH